MYRKLDCERELLIDCDMKKFKGSDVIMQFDELGSKRDVLFKNCFRSWEIGYKEIEFSCVQILYKLLKIQSRDVLIFGFIFNYFNYKFF